MALNKEYFDAIHIDVVKKKYYNANKVEAVFRDIRTQAEALTAENEELRAQLEQLNGKKAEIGEAVISAQNIYRGIVGKANARADEIIASAREERRAIIQESHRQQEYAVAKVEKCYARMKEQHMAAIEAINAEWQEFLCGLFPEDEEPIPAVPADLSDKLGAIAKQLKEIDEN